MDTWMLIASIRHDMPTEARLALRGIAQAIHAAWAAEIDSSLRARGIDPPSAPRPAYGWA